MHRLGCQIFYNYKRKSNITKLYALKSTVTTNLEDDPTANCTNYDKVSTYENCRKKEALSVLVPLLGCVPPMLKDHSDVNETCVGNRSDTATIYLRSMLQDWFKTTCRVPCTTVEYTSVFQDNLQGWAPGVLIKFDRDVTYWVKKRSVTFSTVWENLGSAMGLWLGFGVLQLGEKIEEIMLKLRNKCFVLKTNNRARENF